MDRRASPHRIAHLLSVVALFSVYFVIADASYQFVFPPGKNALFWLPSGLNVALFVRTAPSRWPGWACAIFLAETTVVIRHGAPPEIAVAWGIAACLMPLVGALLLHRYAAPAPFAFRHVRDVFAFVGLGRSNR